MADCEDEWKEALLIYPLSIFQTLLVTFLIFKTTSDKFNDFFCVVGGFYVFHLFSRKSTMQPLLNTLPQHHILPFIISPYMPTADNFGHTC